jgi:hypothetical protein
VKETVKIVKLNWDEECEKDFIIGKGIKIYEPAFKGREEKSIHGIHSPLFATDWEDEDAFQERYSCKCKELKGMVYEGEICPICKTKVKFRDVDLRIFGWIQLNNHCIIQPIFFKKIKTIIGEKQFTEIIEYDKDTTRDGLIIDKQSKNPFKGIGLIEFRDRFEEIMDYFKDKKKNKLELIQEVLDEKEKVFTSCIPVYSCVLRPVSFKGESYFYSSIDKKYNVILSLANALNANKKNKVHKKKKTEKMDEPKLLHSLQKKLMELFELVFMQINQKDGHIKDQILGLKKAHDSLIAGNSLEPCLPNYISDNIVA